MKIGTYRWKKSKINKGCINQSIIIYIFARKTRYMKTQMILFYEEMESRLGDGFSDESTMKMVLDRICAHFNEEDRKCLEQIYTTETPIK